MVVPCAYPQRCMGTIRYDARPRRWTITRSLTSGTPPENNGSTRRNSRVYVGTPMLSSHESELSGKSQRPQHRNTEDRSSLQPSGGAQDSRPSTSGLPPQVTASLSVLGGFAFLAGGGYLLKDQIAAFIDYFIVVVEGYGSLGYLAYFAVYVLLELLAVPAIPLTMTAGVIFGPMMGTGMVSVAATTAAAMAFLIARYAARDKVVALAEGNPKFSAIDKALGKDSFKVVTLLRLSPLLPFAASNYLYGLTSVEFVPYVLGSWIGMLPGSFAYVAAGAYSKVLLDNGGEQELTMGNVPGWQVALGLTATLTAVWYINKIAREALAEVDGMSN